MIQTIRGTVSAVEGSLISIDIGGISFGMQVPHPALYAIGTQAQVQTYLHWHQETGPQLFGFTHVYERQVFVTLISCPGIGPKMGLTILQQTSAQTLATAIALKDIATLSSFKGIGNKKAETLISQLHEKMSTLAQQNSCNARGSGQDSTGNVQAIAHLHQLTQALQALNYTRPEITVTIDHLKNNNLLANHTFDALLRSALSFLAKTNV